MMKSEFESLAGRNVTDEQYKAIETLYMSSNLEKAEFVKKHQNNAQEHPTAGKEKGHQENGCERPEWLQKDTERVLLPYRIR